VLYYVIATFMVNKVEYNNNNDFIFIVLLKHLELCPGSKIIIKKTATTMHMPSCVIIAVVIGVLGSLTHSGHTKVRH